MHQHSLDLLCLAESWLDKTLYNSELFIPQMKYLRVDRNHKRGGGLFILYNPNITCSSENHIMHNDIELLHLLYRKANYLNLLTVLYCIDPHLVKWNLLFPYCTTSYVTLILITFLS